MDNKLIIDAVDKSIEELCWEFRAHPTLYYTENDIMCYFYIILQRNLPISKAHDRYGYEHFLVHREYPTPFRCDMSASNFEMKNDDARTPKGGKYQRGHYDIVILNPDFIAQFTYDVIKAQDYESYKDHVIPNLDRNNPVVLYGVEFMYSRDPLKFSRGQNREKGIDEFVARIKQDANKLVASKKIAGFMDHIKMLTFVKGSPEEICMLLSERLLNRKEILLCFGY